MSAESVGSCAGGCRNAPPKHSLPNPTSPFREERKLSPNTPDKPCNKRGHWARECPSKTSPFQEERNLSPNNPDKPYSNSTICYNCKQEGHWARECPLKGKERSPGPSLRKELFSKCPPNHPELLCKTCQQPCVVRTSHTAANPDRDFYTCPRGQACKMFQWCDEVGKIKSQHVNSPVKPINQHGAAASQNPICTCTAGPCRVETKQHGEWKGRKYFACHLKSVMGQGHCTHFEWCDGLGDDGETKQNLNCSRPVLFEEHNRGEILEKELAPAFPPPVPTTPRAGHMPDHLDSASSPMNRFTEEEVRERIGSPSLNCYLNEGPETLEPNREAVGRTLVVSPPLQQQSQMKRPSLAEGSSAKREDCLVCGGAGHGVEDCDVLAQLAAAS